MYKEKPRELPNSTEEPENGLESKAVQNPEKTPMESFSEKTSSLSEEDIESFKEEIQKAIEKGSETERELSIKLYKKDSPILFTIASEVKAKPVEWLWKKWLPKGKLTLLAGKGGIGKSTIALELAAIISKGGEFPDGKKAKIGYTYIWSAEDTKEDTTVPRLKAAKANLKRIIFIDEILENDVPSPFDPSKDIQKLQIWIKAMGNCELLIIDPLINAITGDSHKSNDVRRGLAPLIALAEKINCAVLGIHHFNKGKNGKSYDELIHGSIGFKDLARTVIAVVKGSEGICRMAKVKANNSTLDGAIEFTIDNIVIDNNIETSNIRWLKVLNGNGETLLQEIDRNESPNRQQEAENFLKSILSKGDLEANLIYKEVEKQGISQITLRRAKEKLKIMSYRKGESDKKGGGTWYWKLPDQEKETNEQEK